MHGSLDLCSDWSICIDPCLSVVTSAQGLGERRRWYGVYRGEGSPPRSPLSFSPSFLSLFPSRGGARVSVFGCMRMCASIALCCLCRCYCAGALAHGSGCLKRDCVRFMRSARPGRCRLALVTGGCPAAVCGGGLWQWSCWRG